VHRDSRFEAALIPLAIMSCFSNARVIWDMTLRCARWRKKVRKKESTILVKKS
jgi:hypothetical protein